jgi:hypothetical protein
VLATHGDTGTAKLMAHSGPGNAQLGTDVAQGPTLDVQVGCPLNVQRRHRNGAVPKDMVGGPSYRLRRIGTADSLALRV